MKYQRMFNETHLLGGSFLLLQLLFSKFGNLGRFSRLLLCQICPRLVLRRLLPQLGQLLLQGHQLVPEGSDLGLEVSDLLGCSLSSWSVRALCVENLQIN